MCMVHLVHDVFPLVSTRIALMLSWCRILSSIFMSCANAKSLDHSNMGRGSSIPTNSDYVELLVFSFCFVEMLTTVPYPRDIWAPVWPLVPLCTAKAVLTDQYMLPFLSDPRIRGRCGYIWRYFITHVSFL